MTDEELAKEMRSMVRPSLGEISSLAVWEMIARRARELLTQELITARLLPEERAVLEAAKEWGVSTVGETVGSLSNLWEAVRRLRQSQLPKPRYQSRTGPVSIVAACSDIIDTKTDTRLTNLEVLNVLNRPAQ